ncbi:MAG TPA: hypothetical protein GX711_02540 [Clostridia bacterium]|nr:hypothetical protein [Clostridia bacterium]
MECKVCGRNIARETRPFCPECNAQIALVAENLLRRAARPLHRPPLALPSKEIS